MPDSISAMHIWAGTEFWYQNIEILRSKLKFKNNADIEWNFTKFLLDKEGQVVCRVATNTPIKTLSGAISKLI